MKYLLLIGALAFSALAFGQKKAWTLQECIAYAYQNNLTIQQNELNVRTAELSQSAAQANLLPNLNFSAGYFWQFGFNIDPITNTRKRGNRQTSSLTLASSWVIFDGLQNYKQISQARIDRMAAMYNLEAIKNDIGINIASAYLQILLNKQVLEVAQNQLRISDGQLARTQKLYDAGAVPKGDLLQLEAQVAGDEQSVIAAENNLEISKLQLAQLLQLDTQVGFDIETPDLSAPDNALLSYTPEQVYAAALNNQPIIKSAELNVESAETQVSSSKGAYAPTLTLSGQINTNAAQDLLRITDQQTSYVPIGTITPGGTDYVYSVTEQTYPTGTEAYPFFAQFEDNLNQFVGLNLQVPIFNRMQIKNNVQSSKLQLEQARLQLESQKNALRQTIQRAYADATASLKSYTAAQKSLSAAEESWQYAQSRFQEGAINTFDYDNTRNRYLSATATLLQNKYDYIFKIKVLEFYLTNNITL